VALVFVPDSPLAPRTTFEVGGPARFYAEAASLDDLAEAHAWAAARSLPLFVLGGGSNLVVADRGLDALVLRVRVRGVAIEDRGDEALVRAGAGEPWDDLVATVTGAGLAGLECLSGIPGDVGATPIQNVGAYGREVGEVIDEVELWRRSDGAREARSGSRCGFAYRHSVFKGAERGAHVVTRVAFRLARGVVPEPRYGELSAFVAQRGVTTLAGMRAAVIELRRAKSMVLDPSDPNHRCAGSFFMNPIVDADEAPRIRERAIELGALEASATMPAYPAGEGRVKLAAGWLIERAGFTKGTARGAVGLSTKHALAIVNRGGARASDIVGFAREIRDAVQARLGVRIVPEPELVGFDPAELGDLVDPSG
jgi:UDP-N-acetylmuramate dehydrogenase